MDRDLQNSIQNIFERNSLSESLIEVSKKNNEICKITCKNIKIDFAITSPAENIETILKSTLCALDFLKLHKISLDQVTFDGSLGFGIIFSINNEKTYLCYENNIIELTTDDLFDVNETGLQENKFSYNAMFWEKENTLSK